MSKKVNIVNGQIVIKDNATRRSFLRPSNTFDTKVFYNAPLVSNYNTRKVMGYSTPSHLATETFKKTSQDSRVHLVGMKIDPEQLSDTTMVVLYRTGECFDSNKTIDWDEPETGVIEYGTSVNLNKEPGINLPNGGWGYAGFHAPTGTCWRYKEEGEINFGEHCMQILNIVHSYCNNNSCEQEHCHRCNPRPDCNKHEKCIESRKQ
jgi:hypothetical protein